MADDAIRRAQAIAAKWQSSNNGTNANNDITNNAVSTESTLGKRKSDNNNAAAPNKRPHNNIVIEKVYIPVNERKDIQWVGLICGPKGSNIARMREASSGCQVKLRGKGSTRSSTSAEEEEDLHVVLEGTNAQIDIARSMINDLIENPDKVKREQLQSLGGGIAASFHHLPQPSEDDPSEEMYVPSALVGVIIGRGGEKIRELQILSGASIQMQREIEMEPGQEGRRLTIRGQKEKIEKAKELINLTMEEHKREQELKRMQRSGSHNHAARAQVLRGGPIHRKVRVLDNTVGTIIGKGGVTINYINKVSGAFINIPNAADESDSRYRTVTICGPTEQSCELAQNEMVKVLQQRAAGQQNGNVNQSLPPGQVMEEFKIPNEHAGRVIGKQGSTINKLKGMFNVSIQVIRDVISTESGQMRNVVVKGFKQNVEACKNEIARIISIYSQNAGLEMVGGDRSRLSRPASNEPYYMQQQMMMGSSMGQQQIDPNNPYAAQWAAYYAQQAILQQQQQQQQQASANVGTSSDQEDPERKKNLDPSNPYRQQWVQYYAQLDQQKAGVGAATTDGSTNEKKADVESTSNGNNEKNDDEINNNHNNSNSVNAQEQPVENTTQHSTAINSDTTANGADNNNNNGSGNNANSNDLAEQWARYFESNKEQAIANGYTQQHYDQYLQGKQQKQQQ